MAFLKLAIKFWLQIAIVGPVTLHLWEFVVRNVERLQLVGSDHPDGAILGSQNVD